MISETLQVFSTLIQQHGACYAEDLSYLLWNMSFAGEDVLASLIYESKYLQDTFNIIF